MVIRSFRRKEVELFFESGKLPKKCPWAIVSRIAKRKLDMLHFASELHDLKTPPSNHLEKLVGNFDGFYSIRINDKWRIVFEWNLGPKTVDIIDYH